MEFTKVISLVLLYMLLVSYTFRSLFLGIIVILAFILAKTSFPVNNASISPSSPSHMHVYSRSLVTFASSFNSFKRLISHCYTSLTISKVLYFTLSLLSTGALSIRPFAVLVRMLQKSRFTGTNQLFYQSENPFNSATLYSQCHLVTEDKRNNHFMILTGAHVRVQSFYIMHTYVTV